MELLERRQFLAGTCREISGRENAAGETSSKTHKKRFRQNIKAAVNKKISGV
jgi:hypothetical protein